MKRILSIVFVFTLFVNTISRAISDKPLSLVCDMVDDEIVLSLNIDDKTDICGLSFNVEYPNDILTFENYSTSALLDNAQTMVNDAYANNMVRVIIAGTEVFEDTGEAISFRFKPITTVSSNIDFKLVDIKIADEDTQKIQLDDLSCTYSANQSTTPKRGGGISSSAQASSTDSNQTSTISNTDNFNVFTDVNKSDWFYDYVKTMYEGSYMNGVSDTEFAPNERLTRAMFVTVLYRLEGEPAFMNDLIFDDVETGSYYEKAVVWANGKGIVSGVSETAFAPNDNITREQIATILYRYAKYKELDIETITADTNTLSYNDIFDVSEWASEGMHFCIAAGIINGDENGNINPSNTATRAEMAAMISRYLDVEMKLIQ